ncbi:MAG: hypothetical protein EBZ48_07015, partial [Proteobacteria bacterium]|nr:hypothetical protein [Pseudomonadota bacterium]
MELGAAVSHELSSLIQQGKLWRAEGIPPLPVAGGAPTKALRPPKERSQPKQHFLAHGLPVGAVHEWSVASQQKNSSPAPRARTAPPPLSIITAILRANMLQSATGQSSTDPRLLLWIGKSCWPTPHLLAQASHSGVNLLSRSLFIDSPDTKTKLWAIDAALRSPGVFGVVAQCTRLSTTMSRRFALAAAHGGTIGCIVRPEGELSLPSAAMSRWKVRAVAAEHAAHSGALTNPFHTAPRW